MSITTSRTAVIIIIMVWVLTLGRSVIIMFGGNNIFKKAYKNESSAFIPVLNLFYMLEIGDVSTFFGILFFVPFLNLLPLMLMGAGVGKNFKCSGGFTMGLMFLPMFFYPMLAFSDKSYSDIYLFLLLSGNSGSSFFILAIYSSVSFIATKSGSGKYL